MRRNITSIAGDGALGSRQRGSQMTIGELARAAGVPTTTLRYYERCGLIVPSSRSAAKYRLYGSEVLRRVNFVRSAQAVGFALEDIAALFSLEQSGGRQCQAEVRALLEKRLADTEERLRVLELVRVALRSALERCAQSSDKCAVMLELGSHASGKQKNKRPAKLPRHGARRTVLAAKRTEKKR